METRLTQPIPAVGHMNNVTSSSVANDRWHTEMDAVTRPHRVQWTEDLMQTWSGVMQRSHSC